MRLAFLGFCIILIASCSGRAGKKMETLPEEMKAQAVDISGYKKHTVQLINRLGSITIYLPSDLDTFYTYADFGEYHCGETKQYRFASRKFGLGYDVDDSYSDPTDSLFQLTIVQTYNKDCETHISVDDTLLASMQKDKNYKYTIIDARGKKIIAGVREMKQDSMDVSEVNAITSVSGRQVRLSFQCYKKSSQDFVSKMMASLKTMEIQEDGGEE